MKKIIPIITAIIALCAASSCNEKPTHYSFVQNYEDGKQIVERIDAKNDTDALKLFIDRMSAILLASMADSTTEKAPIKDMFIISPKGDTLNTNAELMQVIEKQLVDQKQVITE